MKCPVVIKKMDQFINAADRVVVIMGVFCMMSSAFLLFIGVIARYLFSKTFPLFEELSVNLVIWAVMLYAGHVFKLGSHVGMEFLSEKFQGRKKAIHQLVLNITISLILLILAWKGFELVQGIHQSGRTTHSGELEVWYMVLAMPVGAAIYGIYVIAEIVKIIFGLAAPELLEQMFPSHSSKPTPSDEFSS